MLELGKVNGSALVVSNGDNPIHTSKYFPAKNKKFNWKERGFLKKNRLIFNLFFSARPDSYLEYNLRLKIPHKI